MAHCNTIFHQVLRLLDRHDFRKIEQDRFRPKRKCRTLSRWGQFVVMMFAQITGRSSLREIVQQFEFHATKLYHLGVDLVKRTTLADANSKRNVSMKMRHLGLEFSVPPDHSSDVHPWAC